MHQHIFPENVIAEAETIKDKFDVVQSRNYTEAITIDGPDSRDLDDAIFMEYYPDKFVVYISIADVSEYIMPGTSLFNEALKRVSTQYFANNNIPMLPSVISEDSLSLLEKQKRPALTFTITLTRELEIINTEINKTILFNRRRLNYVQVDYILDSCPDDQDYQLLNDCYILARRLMDKRRKQGALVVYDLQRLVYTNEEGMLIRMTPNDAHKSNIIIQEFMILVNMTVAQFAAENDFPFLYRNHTARLNTPGREEIMEQLQSTLLNKRLFDNLVNRAGFWFNKAMYEISLKGHYGLNLPAYTHISSPLRRVPDLINHILLKAHLWEDSIPFTAEDLKSMAFGINNFVLDTQQEKKNFHKEKSKEQVKEKVSTFDMEKLLLSNNKELKTILKEVSRSSILPSGFEIELVKRLKEYKIGVEHLDIIMFETPKSDDAWKELRNLAFETIMQMPGYSLQLLYIKKQSGFLSDLKTEIIESNGVFISRIICRISSQELSTAYYQTGNSKKEAQQMAANEFLKGYFTDQLVPPSETKRNDNLSIIIKSDDIVMPEEEICEENFVGKLSELCISRNYSAPQFEFTQAGIAHAPIFNCHCKIQVGNKTKKAMGSSGTKQNAKQLSAKKMFEMLLDKSNNSSSFNNEFSTKPEPPAIVIATEIIKENYIGILLELCRKSHYPEPSFDFAQAGTQHQPVFSCTATLKLNKNILTGTGIGTYKKNAKHIASKKLIEQIEAMKKK